MIIHAELELIYARLLRLESEMRSQGTAILETSLRVLELSQGLVEMAHVGEQHSELTVQLAEMQVALRAVVKEHIV